MPGSDNGDGSSPPEPPTLVGLEFLIDDIDQALELFCTILGFTEVTRYPHPDVDAEVVVVDAGAVAINLLHRTAVGDRATVLDPEVNLSQLLFTVPDGTALHRLQDDLAESGAGVVVDDDTTIHLSVQGTRAILGMSPALVFRIDPGEVLVELPDPS